VVKAVAASTYDVSEAWLFIAVLGMEQKDLAAVTESQLAKQRFVIQQMKKLVGERNQAREELKKLLESR
jgi:hypothetical protein